MTYNDMPDSGSGMSRTHESFTKNADFAIVHFITINVSSAFYTCIFYNLLLISTPISVEY